MTTLIIISLLISALLILEDCLTVNTLKMASPATSAQLYQDTEYDYIGDPSMDIDTYINWRIHNS